MGGIWYIMEVEQFRCDGGNMVSKEQPLDPLDLIMEAGFGVAAHGPRNRHLRAEPQAVVVVGPALNTKPLKVAEVGLALYQNARMVLQLRQAFP